jgi:hypothetical protein
LPALFVSALALAVALGGGIGYAAGQLPKHSVGKAQLKKNAVTGKAIKAGAVTADKIRAGSLTGTQIKPDSLTGAQIDESTLSLPAEPGVLWLTGLDFHPRKSDETYTSNGHGDLVSTGGGEGYQASLPLPAGTTVTSATIYYVDNGADEVQGYFVRFNPATGSYQYSAGVESTGASSAVRAMSMPVVPASNGPVAALLVYLPTNAAYSVDGAEVHYQ